MQFTNRKFKLNMKIQIGLFTISSKELFYSAGVESRDFLSKFAETIPNQSNMGNWENKDYGNT